MLKIFSSERAINSCTLLLGGFDGLHLGHRALLACAKKGGYPVGITTILGGKGKALFTRKEREFLFSKAGIDFALEIEFTDQIKNTSAEDFLRGIFEKICVKRLVCGEDFRFGRGAEGTPAFLKELSPCPVEVVSCVKSDYMRYEFEGARMRKISTSACKKHLERGELSLLNACLGAADDAEGTYFIGGTVEHGRQVGRTIGFPTLNLSVCAEKLLPPDGVYGGVCATGKGNFPAIINIGARPTFGVEERKIEAYLDGFSGDLYGTEVRVYPMRYLRPIMKFPSEEALKKQLENDKERINYD